MFFPRLRRQAKWMFVFLALVFGLGFVIFGVGSSLPSGLGDVLRDVQRSSATSVGDARERVREHPNDPDAYRELARAYQQDQRPDDSIAPLQRYVKLRPRDESALRELAGLYASKANRLERESTLAAFDVQEATTGTLVAPTLGSSGGPQPGQGFFQQGALEQAVYTEATERYNRLYGEAQQAYKKAQGTYASIARREPRDPQLQLLLGTAAERGGDLRAAVAAYKRFLKLAPEDSSARAVRRQIKVLQKQLRAPATTTTVSPLSGGG
jgi:tetratricopeptide (TPR) repeat protein